MEILLGIDDTDIPDWPGTNKLAMALALRLEENHVHTRRILRHQLWLDAAVPYTSGNGSASMLLKADSLEQIPWLEKFCAGFIEPLCPEGSDPAMCLCPASEAVGLTNLGWKATQEWVSPAEAMAVARERGVLLRSLKGRDHGVVGALAAVGLAASGEQGRVVFHEKGYGSLQGVVEVEKLIQWGIKVEEESTGQILDHGLVDLVKKLRPNIRHGLEVLFVEKGPGRDAWIALKRH
ncbi:MAG: hypothetical protein EXR99_00025 [Gemmataceae bacterium]|nr:hypothetical protein [Gemmataceae bacterium]